MENKYKCHLAIGQFEFIEKEVEGGTDEEFAKSVAELRRLIDKPEGVGQDKLVEMINSISGGGSIQVEDFEGLSESENTILQAVKRAYKRSPEAKDNQVKR